MDETKEYYEDIILQIVEISEILDLFYSPYKTESDWDFLETISDGSLSVEEIRLYHSMYKNGLI